MGELTPIEWTDASWNPVGGCEIAGPECKFCYAMKLAGTRLKNHPLYAGTTTMAKTGPVFNGKMTAAEPKHAVWSWPCRWRGAKNPVLGPGMPSLIFVDDMADLFHKDRPRDDIDRVIAGITYSRHIGQLLTKRAQEMRDYFLELEASGRWLLFPHPILAEPNWAPEAEFRRHFMSRLWCGVSVGTQRAAEEKIPLLLETPAPIRFLSCEPLLEPLNIRGLVLGFGAGNPANCSCGHGHGFSRCPNTGAVSSYCHKCACTSFQRVPGPGIHQVIAGGESGKGTRPAHPDWFRSLRDQCAAAGVAFFFKQWGEWRQAGDAEWHGCGPDGAPSQLAMSPKGETAGGFLSQELSDRREREGWVPMTAVGKKRSGRLLDGREHNGMPVVLA